MIRENEIRNKTNERKRKARRKRKIISILFILMLISFVSVAVYMTVIVTWIISISYPSVLLIHPTDNETINTNTTYFTWTGSGGNDTLWYVWYIDTNPTFTSPNLRVIDVNTTTNYTCTPLMDGDWYWRVEVTDNETINVSSTNHLIVLTEISNDFPYLTNPSVTPTVGNTLTTFYYNITFNDADNDTATDVFVYIDGIQYLMIETDITDINTTDGKNYTYSTTLSRGDHNYSFSCSDGIATNSTTSYFDPTVYGLVEQDNEFPEDGAINITMPINNFSIYVYDMNGSLMDLYLYENSSGNFILFNQSLGITNGTYTFTNTSWVSDINTTYYWSVNITNGYMWSNRTYILTTFPTYYPVIISYYPINNSVILNTDNLLLTVNVFSHNSSLMNITWYTNYSGSWQELGNYTLVSNGEYSQTSPNISSGEKLYWRVNITDIEGLYTESPIYNYQRRSMRSYDIIGLLMVFGVLPIIIWRKRRRRK